jgi:hypothetical protein
MDEKTFLYRLKIPLIEKDYGNTAAEVLKTCALVAEYAQEHTPEQIKSFQEEVSINTQVWSRLIALHKDSRLKKHLEQLPASYTALYAVSRMKDEEIEAAIQQGIIHPEASSHSILNWTKEKRLVGGETVPPWRCLVVFEEEIGIQDGIQMRERMNKIAQEYGAKLISEADYIPSESKENQIKRGFIERLELTIVELATPIFVRMTEGERSKASVTRVEDFLEVDLMTFGSVLRADAKFFEGGSNVYQPIYVYRLALEYLKTDSRSQRFNYKRRLKQLADAQPDLTQCIDEVMQTILSNR